VSVATAEPAVERVCNHRLLAYVVARIVRRTNGADLSRMDQGALTGA